MTRKELVKKLRQAIALINSGTMSAREACLRLEITRSTLIRNTARDEKGNLYLMSDSENIKMAGHWLEKAKDSEDIDFMRYCIENAKKELEFLQQESK